MGDSITTLAFALHIGGGTLGLGSGIVASYAKKGGRVHRAAGKVFSVSMLVMATFAMYLGVVRPNQIVNVFIGTLTFYLVSTAWLAVRQPPGTTSSADKVGFLVALILLFPFGAIVTELLLGVPLSFKSPVPIKGPVLVALYTFTAMLALAAIGDARLLFAGGISGTARIARHLWRMCLGLTFALGSFFTNALPRILPGHPRVTSIYFVPQLLGLAFLVFWMIRVRVVDRYGRTSPAIARSRPAPATM